MGRKNSTTWAAGNPITAARLQNFNQDLDDLYQYGTDRMRIYRLTTDPALQVTIGGGIWRVGDQEGSYAGGTVTVGATATTYIMIDNTGTIQTSTGGWNANYARLGSVVSSGGAITAITIAKIDAIGGSLAGKGIPDMRSSAIGTPNTYAFQAVTGPEFRPQLASDGAGYVGIPGMDAIVSWWTVVTYGNWTTYEHTVQVAYSNSTVSNADKVYIFMRRGTGASTWGAWVPVSDYISGFAEITTSANDGFMLWEDTPGVNKKIKKSNLKKLINPLQVFGSLTSSVGTPGGSWAYGTAQFSERGNIDYSISVSTGGSNNGPTPIAKVQVSRDNTNWTDIASVTCNFFNQSASATKTYGFVDGGVYVRAATLAKGGYSTANASITITT